MTPFEIARSWRQDKGYVGRGVVVVVFNGEVQSWVNKLRNPEHWQPGCIAVDEDGRTWTTIAGGEHRALEQTIPLAAVHPVDCSI